MKALIVDDSHGMCTIISKILKRIGLGGIKTIVAKNGWDALSLFHIEKPDIVICDYKMPDLDGMELLKKIRDFGSSVQFGFVTAVSCRRTAKRAKEAGADFYITKPFTMLDFERELLKTH